MEQIEQHPDASKSEAHGQLIAMTELGLDEHDKIIQEIEQQRN